MPRQVSIVNVNQDVHGFTVTGRISVVGQFYSGALPPDQLATDLGLKLAEKIEAAIQDVLKRGV